MKQQTLAVSADQNAQYEQYRKPTRRDVFLATMEQIVPWAALCEVIEPHYPKAGNGRPPVGLERMLRMYFVQHWFNLADVACEDALLDSTALRRFVGIDLGRERVPDATTLLKFRRLLENHKLGEALFAKVGEVLQAHGMKVGTGTIVDATIIGAPSSTKNKEWLTTITLAGRAKIVDAGHLSPKSNAANSSAAQPIASPGQINDLQRIDDVVCNGMGFGTPARTFAVALGCDVRHAHRLVYATGLNLTDPASATPIGSGCKVCDRDACAQRAFPAIGRGLQVNEDVRQFAPYADATYRAADSEKVPHRSRLENQRH